MSTVTVQPGTETQNWPLFRCPYCGDRAAWDRPRATVDAVLLCAGCGYRHLQHDGLATLLTAEESDRYQPFLRHYRRVRKQEGWLAKPEALLLFPYPPAGTPHQALWRRRAASFERLLALLARRGQQLDILDLGAGCCWLSRQLAARGHRLEAVDLNADADEGLGSIALQTEVSFGRTIASMDNLPYLQDQFDVVVAAAALHYARDLGRAVGEAARVLRGGGELILLDTPIYRTAAAGHALTARRLAEQPRLFGTDGTGTTGPAFVEAAALRRAFHDAGLSYREVAVHRAPRAAAGRMRRTLRSFLPLPEQARMPVVIGARR